MSISSSRLDDICSLITDGTHYTPPDIGEGIPYLTVRDMTPDGLDFAGCAKISSEEFQKLDAGNCSPRIGDILYSKDGTVGKVHLVKEPTKFGVLSSIAILRPRFSDVDNLYLSWALRSPNLISQAGESKTGSALRRLVLKDLKKLTVKLPPLATQKHIARVLEQADQLRKQAQQMESELNQLAQSLFLEMFGDPVKNEKAWPQFSLAKLTTKIGSGATPTGGKEAYKDIGISLIRSLNVHDGEFFYKDLARIDDQQANALSNVVVEPQDVLLNITGASVCRCCVVPHDVLPARVNQHVAILRPDNAKLTTAYLQALIVSPSFKASLLQLAGAAGATREALTKGSLEALQIPTPPLDKQIEYERAMSSISMQIDATKKKQAQLNSLFDSLMQRAFSGELTAPERKAA